MYFIQRNMNNSLRTIAFHPVPLIPIAVLMNSHFMQMSSPLHHYGRKKQAASDFPHGDKHLRIITGKIDISFRLLHTSSVLQSNDPSKSSQVQSAAVSSQEKANKQTPAVGGEPKKKKPLMQRIKDELNHYYHGFKLFWVNLKVSTGLVVKRLRGRPLTRREHRLLVRTVGDIFRLLPFSLFIVVPFLELTLPLYLKLFPGALPSTFQTKSEKEEKRLQQFRMKLEMTKFLQETLEHMSPVQGKERSSDLAKEFADFFAKVRTTGQMASPAEVLKFSKLFEDEITLDKLPRPQIIALCKILDITPIGTTRFLRYQIELKMKKLQYDDRIIKKEGILTMSTGELREACRVRGMRSVGVSKERMQEQLHNWLDLSLIKRIPPTLLLLSQAFSLTETTPTEESIAATIKALPSEVGPATKALITEREGKVDHETAISVVKDELRRINDEKIEIALFEKSRRRDRFLMESHDDLSEFIEKKLQVEDVTPKELSMLEEALAANMFIEKECLADLKKNLEYYEESVQHLQKVISRQKPTEVIIETLAARRLHKKIVFMMKRLDDAIKEMEEKAKRAAEPPDPIGWRHSYDVVEIEELMDTIKKRRGKDVITFKGEVRLHEMLKKLDTNNDGVVQIAKIKKLLTLLQDSEIVMNNEKIDGLIDMILKEERIQIAKQRALQANVSK